MYRIKDPKRSLEFYTNVLGMRYESFMLIQLLASQLYGGNGALCVG
jgi:catechol 2,3-dioxygenase-like lactoylglutathione lyase family enzyme